MDDRVDRTSDEWDPDHRTAFEFVADLLSEYHVSDLPPLSPVISKCYPHLFATVADAAADAPTTEATDPPTDREGADVVDPDLHPEARRDRALSALDAGDPTAVDDELIDYFAVEHDVRPLTNSYQRLG